MKRLLIAVFAFACLATSAQKSMTLDQIKSQWTTKSLKVASGNGTNILLLFEAFQNAWPTYSGGEMLKFANSKVPYDNNDKVVDIKNGYIAYSEDDPDSENNEQLQACVWRRGNGHSLLAINLHRFEKELDVLCFYDYDPKTKTLNPEKSLVGIFRPSFPGYRYRVFLPQHGKNLEVKEFFGALTITHAYSWDGLKPARPHASIDGMEMLQGTFKEHVVFAEEHPLTQYSLIDIDKDGFPELWLRSADKSYQAVFAVKLTNEYLGGQDDRRTLSFYKGAVAHSGTCGTLCMSSNYCLLENSCRKSELMHVQEYDMNKNEYTSGKYTLDGKEVAESEATQTIQSLGEAVEYKANWKDIDL